MAFEATIRCDCPYAYGFPFEKSYQIKDVTRLLFRNESSMREYLKPVISFKPNPGITELKIVNKNDNNRIFSLSGLSSNMDIVIDNNNGIIQETNYGYNLYDGFNLNFFRLVHGDNILEVTGDGVLTISGRFLYNVAG